MDYKLHDAPTTIDLPGQKYFNGSQGKDSVVEIQTQMVHNVGQLLFLG